MIHELLLALSGHPSPLLKSEISKDSVLAEHLSPPELTLLQRLAHDLGGKRVQIHNDASSIISSHPSIVCRAVANAIISVHLAHFQERIIQIERDLLQQKPNLVGAYNVVPLSGIVIAFDGWKEKLDWLAHLVRDMHVRSPDSRRQQKSDLCDSKQIIEHLRRSALTGYPDIEKMAEELGKVAESTWLKQASLWILYGELPSSKCDFFIHPVQDNESREVSGVWTIDQGLVPNFVVASTASSILFVGKILNDVGKTSSDIKALSPGKRPSVFPFLYKHIEHLSAIAYPINTTELSAAVSAIRKSISENLLQNLLPTHKTLEILQVLRQFFLLDNGVFTVALINAADERLAANQIASTDRHASGEWLGLDSLTIKRSEVSSVLARTWTSIATYPDTNPHGDGDALELAQSLLRLSIGSLKGPVEQKGDAHGGHRSSMLATFDDLLLPTPTTLSMSIPRPLDLYFTSSAIDVYSQIHAYLLSIRRASHQLNKLYLLSKLRRQSLARSSCTTKPMRTVWASVTSVIYVLSELGDFMQGAIVRQSWEAFTEGLQPSVSTAGSRPSTGLSKAEEDQSPTGTSFRDPDAFVEVQDRFLDTLTKSLLLDHEPFTKELRSLLSAIDHLCALIQRMNYAVDANVHEQQSTLQDMEAAQRSMKKGLKAVVAALHVADRMRMEEAANPGTLYNLDVVDFVPWESKGMDHLLLKLGHFNEAG